MSDLPDGPFNTPPGTTWRQLDPPERKRDQDEDDRWWQQYWLYQGTEPEDKLYEQ
ncbi:MAG: hypothetical protein V4563_14935 [Pseudomonadota bacterium]